MIGTAKHKKIIACAAFMLFALACAFSGGNSESGRNAGTESRRNAGQQIEKLDEARAAPVQNISGYKVRYAAHWPGPDENTRVGRVTLDLWRRASAKYDVTFEWIEMPNPNSLMEKMVSTILVGEPFADLIWVDGGQAIPALAEANLILPLDEYVDLNDPRWPKQIKEACVYKGKTYGVYPWILAGGSGIWYNRTLFQREGLPDLYELQEKGQWTWEKYFEIAKAATKDLDGDGKIDQWGIAIGYEIEYPLIYSNGAAVVEEKDGKYRFALDTPQGVEALEFIGRIYRENITSVAGESLFVAGRAAMYGGELFQGANLMQNMQDEYGWVFYPKGPAVNDYTSVAGVGAMLSFPANLNYPPERLGQILLEITPLDHGDEIRQEFLEGTLTHRQDMETVEKMIDKMPNEACRMNRILIPLVLAGLSFSCCIIDPIIQDPAGEEASVTVSSISIPTQDFTAGLVPFTDYRGPYHRLNDANPPVRNRTWKTVELSNRYVKVVAVPELGGRILKFVNLATGNNEFYENPEGIKVNGWGRNGWWAATGGVEFMFPFDEHGGGFYLPYNHAKNPDAGAEWRTEKTGSGVTLSMGFSEKEQFGLVRWRHDLEIEVPNAGAYFTVTHTVTNESAVTRDLMFWSNAMISPGPGNMRVSSLSSLDHQVVFDRAITRTYNHNNNLNQTFWGDGLGGPGSEGNPWDVVNWPVHTGRLTSGRTVTLDVSLLSNWYEYDLKFAGLFAKGGLSGRTSGTYLGQYNLTADEGVVKLFPAEIVPGTPTGAKYWHWGSFSQDASWSFADGDSTYAELMTGPARVFQEPTSDPASTAGSHPTGEPYAVPVAAGESLTWRETFLAPWGIGGITEADSDGAYFFDRTIIEATRYRVLAGYFPAEKRSGLTVRILQGDTVVFEESGLQAGPGRNPAPLFRELELRLSSSAPLTLEITDSDGTVKRIDE